jgi:hypothetical protein
MRAESGLVASLVFLASVSVAYSADADFRRIGGQGKVDFMVASPVLAKDTTKLHKVAKEYANKNRTDWCKLLIWSDGKKAAKKLPMTDAQVNSQVASYERNKATGLDRLRILKNGDVVKDVE